MDYRRTVIISSCFLFLAAGSAVYAVQEARTEYPSALAKHDCSFCHVDPAVNGPGALKKQVSLLCLDCHPDRLAPKEHQVDIVPVMDVKGLPLFGGKLTCATCHDPHTNRHGSLLRKPATELCRICHPY